MSYLNALTSAGLNVDGVLVPVLVCELTVRIEGYQIRECVWGGDKAEGNCVQKPQQTEHCRCLTVHLSVIDMLENYIFVLFGLWLFSGILTLQLD